MARQAPSTNVVHTWTVSVEINGRNEIKPGKFKVKWLGPYKLREVVANRSVKLWILDGREIPDAVNGSKFRSTTRGKEAIARKFELKK